MPNKTKAVSFIIIDGSGYLFRAFYAMPGLTNAQGMATGAVYGVLNMLRKLEKDYPGVDKTVVFDPKGKTERHQWYPEYKANRGVMPEDLGEQIPVLFDAIKALGLPLHVCPGIEADDVIGTLAKMAVDKDHQVVICSGDKDFAQLVSERVTVVDSMRGRVYDREGVYEKFQVWPEQIIDYLALVGDTVDNIPGVEKVGPKTAVKWLSQYQTLDAIIEHAQHIKGKVGENLRAQNEHLALYKRLVTIADNADIGITLDACKPKAQDHEQLLKLYQSLGFKTWQKELESHKYEASPQVVDVEVVLGEDQLQALSWTQEKEEQVPLVVVFLCLEDSMPGRDLGVCLGVGGTIAYLPKCVHQDTVKWCSDSVIASWLEGMLAEKRPVYTNDGKRFWKWCASLGVQCSVLLQDVSVLGYIEKGPGRLRIDQLYYDRLGKLIVSREEAFGTGAKQKTSHMMLSADVAAVLAHEVQAVGACVDYFDRLMQEDYDLKRHYHEVEGPLIRVLAQMESRGVKVDAEKLKQQSLLYKSELQALEQRAHEQAGVVFNLSSPKQLQEVLYDKLALPVREKTPTGQPSTGESALLLLADEQPLCQTLLRFRRLAKLKSTYLDALPECIDTHTGRIHASFNQTVTTTGRLSCQAPNLQNIPIRNAEGQAIRHAFIPEAGFKLLALDYSQIELRIMAHISGDKTLLSAFEKGEDVHAQTAATLYNVLPDAVTTEQRRVAKVFNFGLIYGMSAFGLAKQLGMERHEAQDLIDRYFSKYPEILTTMQKTREQALQQAYVETIRARKVFLHDIRHGQQSVRRAQERAAINAPMQGSAADIIKLAMLRVDEILKSDAFKGRAHTILQVHDELVFEIQEDYVERLRPLIEAAMQNAIHLSVPLLVTGAFGDSWGEIH